jgi:methylated-DNA-[protein]-cysteine S-methyltransferase
MNATENALRTLVDASNYERLWPRFIAEAEHEHLIDVAYEEHETPLGVMLVAATTDGIVRLGLPATPTETVLADLGARISSRVLKTTRASLTQARTQLDQYFNGSLRVFDIVLDYQLCHGFYRSVLNATSAIPYGETRSYKEVAVAANNALAVRATGSALATNPIPIIIPCHRVLRSGGGLGGYGGGLPAQQWLLDWEQRHH